MDHGCGNDRIGAAALVVDAAAPAGPGGPHGRGNRPHPRHGLRFKQAVSAGHRKMPLLANKACVNLFFENSTRTRTSFGLAARRLGADTLDFSASTSSLSKGETFIDTAKNIEAMGIDVMVVRHHTPGTPHLLAQNLPCSVVNAGDGAHEHPTQGLLDILTIRQRLGRIEGLTVALVGDIAHSRTARSNIWGLKSSAPT